MQLLKTAPINRRLTIIIVLTCGMSLLLSGVAIVIADSVLYRAMIRRDLKALAEIVGSNSLAALAFQNPLDAQETLASLRAKSNMIQACIYTADSGVFARYVRSEDASECPTAEDAESIRDAGNDLVLFHPILLNDKKIGSLYFQFDQGAVIASRQKLYFAMVAAIALASMLLALFLSSRLRRLISGPIAHLAESARSVTETKDYGIRAEKETEDDLGQLVDTFNEMLGTIQQRDAELRTASSELERRVEDRTEELRLTNEKLDRFFTLSLDLLCVADVDGYFKRLNPAWEQVTGWTTEELLSQPMLGFVHPDDREATLLEIENLRKGGRVLSFTNRYRCKDGSYRWLSWKSTPEEKESLIYGAARDVTEVRHREAEMLALNEELRQRSTELDASNKELESFTYSVSHDLRAPLRHIDGFSKLLMDAHGSELSEAARDYIATIRESTREMSQLVDDLLNLARLGRRELSLQVAGLGTVVEGVLPHLKAENSGRAIEWKLQPLPFVECDPALMKQVFANLLSNAVKFTRHRNPAVIEVGSIEQGSEAVVYVRDNGAGFDMKYVDKLFGIFQRLHRQEDFEGTGIGLAIVARVIKKHGGRVWAEGELNKGAAFYFTLGTADGNQLKHSAEGVVYAG